MRRLISTIAAIFALGWCVPASAECMARPFKDASNVDKNFQVVVPADEARDYAAKGYQPVACGELDSERYRKRVCELAGRNRAVQRRIEQVLGVSATSMCASVMRLKQSTISPDADLARPGGGTTSIGQ